MTDDDAARRRAARDTEHQAEIAEQVRKTVDRAPPLSQSQIDRLRTIIAGGSQ